MTAARDIPTVVGTHAPELHPAPEPDAPPADPADIDPETGPGTAMTRRGWVSDHARDCWRHHPLCALGAARDLQMARREHAAGLAERFKAAGARAQRSPRAARAEAVAEELFAARLMLEERDRANRGARTWGAKR